MQITNEMIQAGMGAATQGDDGSFVFDYITYPDPKDPDWKAIGGYPEGVHRSYASSDWQWHIVKRILEAALAVGAGQLAREEEP